MIFQRLKDKWRYHRALSTIRQSGIWFVDIPRTSSSSIKAILHQKFGEAYGKADTLDESHNLSQQHIPNHLTARMMMKIIGKKNWRKLTVFSVVRNPWDRHYALYRYRRHMGEINLGFPEYLELFRNTQDHHPASPYRYHGHHYQCWDYLHDGAGNLLVDHIIKFESRDQDLRTLSYDLELGDLSRLHLNRLPDHTSYREVYSQDSIDLVAQISRDDIARFGYRF